MSLDLPIVNVVAAVRTRPGEVWLCRRNADGAHAGLKGLWEYPGGKVEAGEQFKEALLRELDEEFPGCAVCSVGDLIDSIDTPYEGVVYRVMFFHVDMEDPVEHPTHFEVRWMGVKEVLGTSHLPSGTAFNLRHLRNLC